MKPGDHATIQIELKNERYQHYRWRIDAWTSSQVRLFDMAAKFVKEKKTLDQKIPGWGIWNSNFILR